MAKTVEYRVRPVTRYIVTKFTSDSDGLSGVETFGEFLNESIALHVRSALQRDDPDFIPASPEEKS